LTVTNAVGCINEVNQQRARLVDTANAGMQKTGAPCDALAPYP